MTTAIVLAAGSASRFGSQKLLAPIAGTPMLDRVLAAVAHLPTVVVAAPDLRAAIANRPDLRIVENANPERGMTHSLRLADLAIDARSAILVVLADMPWVTRAIVDAVIAASATSDICYPERDGIGGHPVFFSPNARAKIAALPDGDAIRTLRDDRALDRRTIQLDDDGAYRDVDTQRDVERGDHPR